jgi:hypothetical protein
MFSVKEKTTTSNANQHEEWFENLIKEVTTQILKDKSELEEGVASNETTQMYEALANNNILGMISSVNQIAAQLTVRQIVYDYIKQIKQQQIDLNKLAFDLSSNRILIWAEINDDDEISENKLITAESIVNANYFDKTNYCLVSTIVESSDNIQVPPHYSYVN